MNPRSEMGGRRGESRSSAFFSWRRVGALLLRHLYVLRSSWPRLLELAYWPTVQMLLWGFVTLFFVQHSTWVAQAAGILVSAVLLWEILFRSNLGLSITFMEEMWARNLSSLFASPMRPHELVVSLAIMSFVRTMIGVVPAMLLAVPLFGVSVFALGLPLVGFFVILQMFGWSVGRARPPARARRRELGVGGGIRARPLERRLLSARRPAVVAAADRLVAAVLVRLRGHACGVVREPLPPRLAECRRGARPGLHGARQRVLPVHVPRRAGARFAAAAGRMKCWR